MFLLPVRGIGYECAGCSPETAAESFQESLIAAARSGGSRRRASSFQARRAGADPGIRVHPRTGMACAGSVLAHYPQVQKAVLYGSRARGNCKIGADIDLTLIGGDELDLSVLGKIMDDFTAKSC